MAFRFKIGLPENIELTPQQEEQFNNLRQKYNNKICNSREEVKTAYKELCAEYESITGVKLPEKSNKYGDHTILNISATIQALINNAATPEEKDRWQQWHEKIKNKMEVASIKRAELKQKPGALMVSYNSTTMGPSNIEYYPLELEAELNTLLQSFKTELKNEVGRLPVAGADFSNNDLKRDLLELLVGQTDAALNGSLDEQSLNPDDYLLPNSYAGLIPGFSPYGIGKKDPKDISKLYVTDYVRANKVLPLSTVPAKGIKLTNATIEYENKVSGGNVTEADEIKVREVILTEGAECLYAIDKIKKNINHKDVKEAFPGVVDGAYYDSFGGRGQFENWSAINRARRKLIINGWAMSDITAIGRLAHIIPVARGNNAKVNKSWEEYQVKLNKYNQNLTDYNTRQANGEKNLRKPVKPAMPQIPRYTEEELRAVNSLEEKLNNCLSQVPGNEGNRKALLESLIAEIDRMPEQTLDRLVPLRAIRNDLNKALEHQLTDVEKRFLENPAALKTMADRHPVKEYTDAEQQRDLQWIAEIREKDKELNNIFDTDPYAYDHIRAMQSSLGGDTELFVNVVKDYIGEKDWNAFSRISPGREDDYNKALDVLTRPDSPYYVADNHKVLKDVEDALRLRQLNAPEKNYSNIGSSHLTAMVRFTANVIPTIDPNLSETTLMNEALDDQEKGQEKARQKEYTDRLNKVLDSPGDLTPAQQRAEIARCVGGLVMPIAIKAVNHRENNKIFNKENLTGNEKKELEESYVVPFELKGGLINKPFADSIKDVLILAEKGINRAEQLIIESGETAAVINIKPYQRFLRDANRGLMEIKLEAMDPMLKVGEANFRSPIPEDKRKNNPIVPGKTKDFTAAEMEEKAEIFPWHKVINAQYELNDIWGEYLIEQQKGKVSPEREREYWNRMNACYTTIETVTNDLIAKQENDPKFADNNMRVVFGHSTAVASFDDAVSGDRGMKPMLKFISIRRDAIANGWSLSDLGLYTHLAELSLAIEKNNSVLESGGAVTADFTGKLREINGLLNEKILKKPYETDPVKRAELYNEIAEKLDDLQTARDALMDNEEISEQAKFAVKNVLNVSDNVNHLGENGGMPLEYELRSLAAEYRIEAIEAKKKNCLDEIKSVADPIVYNELRSWIRNEPPKQNHLGIDPSFVGKADIYIKSGMGELNKEIEAIRAGKETTLEGKTGLKSENAVDAIRNMLDASDSIFHRDSKQYKTIKESLNKLRDGTATAEDKAKLTADVKTWLTDPGYDRIHKHSKNEFDNTRFNIMFTLANELDPAWAKENFADMNIAGLHGEKADNTSFHNVHEFTNFMHRQMADGGFLMEVRAVESQRWYLKADSYGQKGLVEEVLRVREDTAFTDKDRLKAEQDNIGKLMKGDTGFEQKFEKLVQYHNACMTSLSGNQVALGLGGQYEDKIKNKMDKLRSEAMDGLRTYISNPQNRTAPDYKKAVTAYGVMDPYAAHVFIADMRKNNPADKVIRELNLVDLEKKEGIDLGGRRALREKKQQLRQAEKNNQVEKNNNQAVNNPVLRQQS